MQVLNSLQRATLLDNSNWEVEQVLIVVELFVRYSLIFLKHLIVYIMNF